MDPQEAAAGAPQEAAPAAPQEPPPVAGQDDAHLRYRGWSWWWSGRREFPWLGAFLIAVGAALVVDQAVPGLNTSRVIASFAGLVFWAAFLFSGIGWAGVVAAIVGGWGLSGVLQELGYVAGGGWTPLLIGAGFLVVYLAGLGFRAGRHGWTLWIGLALVLLGAVEIAVRQIPGLPPLDSLVVPVILIALGAFLVFRAVRRP